MIFSNYKVVWENVRCCWLFKITVSTDICVAVDALLVKRVYMVVAFWSMGKIPVNLGVRTLHTNAVPGSLKDRHLKKKKG